VSSTRGGRSLSGKKAWRQARTQQQQQQQQQHTFKKKVNGQMRASSLVVVRVEFWVNFVRLRHVVVMSHGYGMGTADTATQVHETTQQQQQQRRQPNAYIDFPAQPLFWVKFVRIVMSHGL
jgi:hypothetical protein